MDPNSPEVLVLLKNSKNIAVVGLSDEPARPSYGVAKYMQGQGYTIIPVNPKLKTVLGEKAYPSISDIPKEIRVDIVDVFRRSETIPELIDEAIARNPKLIWLQQGVVHEASGKKAEAAGIPVVMDACLAVVHRSPRSAEP